MMTLIEYVFCLFISGSHPSTLRKTIWDTGTQTLVDQVNDKLSTCFTIAPISDYVLHMSMWIRILKILDFKLVNFFPSSRSYALKIARLIAFLITC